MKKIIFAGLRHFHAPVRNRQFHRLAAIFGVAMMMFAVATSSFAAGKTLTWQSTSSTAWATAANWYDEGAAGTSSTAPTSADAVTINSSRGATAQPSVTTASQACSTLVVGNGFTLSISGASGTLTVGDGLTGNNDITIQNGGTIINSSTATTTFTLNNTSNDKFRIDSGGTYVHNTTKSYTTPFPAAQQNFDPNSTFIWRGSSSLAPSVVFSGRTFGNLYIESTSGACTPAANTGTVQCTVNGNLFIGATGAGTVNYTISSGTVTSPWVVAGNISVGSGSTLSFAAIPITLTGNVTNNGTLSVSSSTNFIFNGSAASVSGSGTTTFGGGFIINPGQSVTLSQNVTVNGGTTNNGTLNCGTSIISGTGAFTLASVTTLGIGDPNGITSSGASGNIQASGTRTFNSGANYIYTGTAAQATGSGLPSTVNSLTINNTLAVASGGVTLTAGETVTNLALLAGRLVTSANQVTIPDAGSITPFTGGSGSYVDGNLQKVWASTGTKSFIFPVGAGATFAPCGVTNLVLTSAGNLTGSTTGSEHANIGSSTINSAKDANRYWTMTAAGGLALSTYNAICTFVSGDLDGGANSANFVMQKWNGISWTQAASTSISGNTVIGNAFTSFSDFAVGEPAAVSTSPAGVGGANPATVGRGDSTLLTVTVTPGTFPTSTGLGVTVDLSLIGGSSSQQFYDDGTHGDATAGDNVFSYSATIPTGTSLGTKSLPATITDAQSRTGNATISVTIAGTTRVWSGGGANDNWSNGTNWSDGVSPISPQDSVTFAGSTRLTPSLDSSSTVPGLTFDSSAGSFTLGATGGSTLTLNGGTGLTNNSANPEIVNIPIIMGSAQTFNTAGAGTLTIGGTVDNGGNLLTVDGANNSTFTNAISDGGGLMKVGSGTLTLAGNNSYGGATVVNAGTLAVSGGSAIPDTSDVTLANVANVTLSLNNSETVNSLSGGGATGGTVALGANNLIVGGTTTYSGAITGAGKLVRTGAGTLTLNNAGAIGSSFTTRVEGGLVDFNRGGNSLVGIIGSGNTIELAGGTVQLSASVQASLGVIFNALNVVSNSTISFNRTSASSSTSPIITAPLNFTGNANLNFAYSASITGGTTTFTNSTGNTLQGNGTLTLGSFGVTIANPIGESSGSYSLTKAGAGQLNLNAINTYSGPTTNLQGTVAVNATSTFGNGAGNLVLAGGNILDSNTRATAPIPNPILMTADTTIYGDGNQTNSLRIFPLSGLITTASGTLTIRNEDSNATSTNNEFRLRLSAGGLNLTRPIAIGSASDLPNFNAVAELEFYGTNTDAAQTVSGNISGPGSLFRSLSTGGTTILTGSNTYAGGTIISGGTLLVNNTTGTGTGTNMVSVSSGGTLGGIGSIGGAATLQSGAVLAAGIGGIGTLTFSNALTLNSASTNIFAVTTAGGASNKVAVAGLLTPNNSVIKVTCGTALYPGTNTLFTYGTVSGAFSSSVVFDVAPVHPFLIADNGSGKISLVVPNAPPTIAHIVTNNVISGVTFKIAIMDLKNAAGWSDSDGDTVSFSGVSNSANGTNVTSDANYIYYNGAVTAEDHFNYTVSDGLGGTATGTVYVEAQASTAPVINSPALDVNGHPTFGGLGIPNYIYGVESETNLSGPWVEAGTTTVGSDGTWSFTDVNQSNPTIIFYRLYYPDNPGSPPQ